LLSSQLPSLSDGSLHATCAYLTALLASYSTSCVYPYSLLEVLSYTYTSLACTFRPVKHYKETTLLGLKLNLLNLKHTRDRRSPFVKLTNGTSKTKLVSPSLSSKFSYTDITFSAWSLPKDILKKLSGVF